MIIEPFGNIDLKKLNDYYSADLKVGNSTVAVDLNFENESIEERKLIKVSKYIENIEENLKNAMKAISDDYDLGDESEAAQDYLNHHQEVLDDNELKILFEDKEVSKELFLSKLQTFRVGFYPEDDEDFIIVDIQFPQELTDYLLAVTLDDDLNLSYIGMDS